MAIDIAAMVVTLRWAAGVGDRVAHRQGVLQQSSYDGSTRAEGRLQRLKPRGKSSGGFGRWRKGAAGNNGVLGGGESLRGASVTTLFIGGTEAG